MPHLRNEPQQPCLLPLLQINRASLRSVQRLEADKGCGMSAPTRTVRRVTALPHRGRQIVLTIPPHCDYVSVRQKGTRTRYDVQLAAVYDLAVRQKVALERAAKKKGKPK